MSRRGEYVPRVVDLELDELLASLPAISLEGPRGVGKTSTAARRARTQHRLDEPARRSLLEAAPDRSLQGDPPVLIDEWQQLPSTWDLVRRAVDDDPSPGRYLLTGSAAPSDPPTHTGAGRIVTVRMRPLALSERGLASPTVSLAQLLQGDPPEVAGSTSVRLDSYAEEVVRSGFPGLRGAEGRARRAQLDGYLDRIVERDFTELGHRVRRPQALRRWLRAYAAATATTATFETIRDAATSDRGEKPSRPATLPYRDVLERLWILDPVPGWQPTRNQLSRVTMPPKHHLADPALAARLLGVGVDALLSGREDVASPRDGLLLGHLFESLVALSVRVYAQQAEAQVGHLRTKGGRHEVDLIVERDDHRVLAIEVKLGADVDDADVRHLHWLHGQLGVDLLEMVVVTTGPEAYRRPDGVAVVPAALLGP